MIRIELFGVPQLKAQRPFVDVNATTVGDALHALAEACPALSFAADDLPGSGYVVALNGKQMTVDPATLLADGDVLVLISAQAGG